MFKDRFTQAIFVAQFSAIFVALKFQLQNRSCKPAKISVRRFYCNLTPRFEMQLARDSEYQFHF